MYWYTAKESRRSLIAKGDAAVQAAISSANAKKEEAMLTDLRKRWANRNWNKGWFGWSWFCSWSVKRGTTWSAEINYYATSSSSAPVAATENADPADLAQRPAKRVRKSNKKYAY